MLIEEAYYRQYHYQKVDVLVHYFRAFHTPNSLTSSTIIS